MDSHFDDQFLPAISAAANWCPSGMHYRLNVPVSASSLLIIQSALIENQLNLFHRPFLPKMDALKVKSAHFWLTHLLPMHCDYMMALGTINYFDIIGVHIAAYLSLWPMNGSDSAVIVEFVCWSEFDTIADESNKSTSATADKLVLINCFCYCNALRHSRLQFELPFGPSSSSKQSPMSDGSFGTNANAYKRNENASASWIEWGAMHEAWTKWGWSSRRSIIFMFERNWIVRLRAIK